MQNLSIIYRLIQGIINSILMFISDNNADDNSSTFNIISNCVTYVVLCETLFQLKCMQVYFYDNDTTIEMHENRLLNQTCDNFVEKQDTTSIINKFSADYLMEDYKRDNIVYTDSKSEFNDLEDMYLEANELYYKSAIEVYNHKNHNPKMELLDDNEESVNQIEIEL